MAALTNAQRSALSRLTNDGVLTQTQADAVLAALAPGAEPHPGGGWLAEAAGYLGGGLTLGGAMLVLGDSWEQLTSAGRAGFLAGVAGVLAVAAVLAAGGLRPAARLARSATSARRRVVGVLLALVAPPAAFAVAVGAEGEHAWTWGTLTGFVLSLVVLAGFSTPVAVLVTGGFSVAALLVAANDLANLQLYQNGLLLAGLGTLWIVAALVRLVGPRQLSLTFGATLAIFGAQIVHGDEPDWQVLGYTLTFIIALACLGLYRVARDVAFIVAGVIGVSISVPEAVYDLTDGRVSGAYIVLVAGVVLVLASAVGFRMRQAES